MNRFHFCALLAGTGLLAIASCRTDDGPGFAGTPRMGASGVGDDYGGAGGSGGAAGETPAIEATLEQINNPNSASKVLPNTRVSVRGLVATSKKILVSQSNTSGKCLWGFYATTPGDTTQEYGSIQVVAYGDNAVSVGTGGAAGAAGGPENTDATCSDDVDNDGNGFTDCNDFSCSKNPAVTVCGGAAGSAGSAGAGGAGGAVPENSNDACKDGVDNDGNGFTDCKDFGCQYAPVTPDVCPQAGEDTDAECSDGLDNDGDKRVDCGDFSCSKNPLVTVCNGSAGSSGAGGAGGGSGSTESNNAACSDKVDNDGDNFVDCDDFDCSKNSAVTVCGGTGGAAGGTGALRCPTEGAAAGPIPNEIQPGDLVDVVGFSVVFKQSNCGSGTNPALAVGQHQLENSTATVVGSGAVPAPKEFSVKAELDALGSSPIASDVFEKWGGGLIRMAGNFTIDQAKFPANAPANTADCAAPFGDLVFAETTLPANNNVYFLDMSDGGPRNSSQKRLVHPKDTTFTSITGIYSIDFCTWAVAVRGTTAEDIAPAPASSCVE